MSTDKPSFGSVILQIAVVILKKFMFAAFSMQSINCNHGELNRHNYILPSGIRKLYKRAKLYIM